MLIEDPYPDVVSTVETGVAAGKYAGSLSRAMTLAMAHVVKKIQLVVRRHDSPPSVF